MASQFLRLVGACATLALSVSAAPTTTDSNDARHGARCCTQLQLLHGTDTYLPSTQGYQASLDSYWSLQARIHPSCIVVPDSTQAVSKITKTLVSNSCPFAIRSGGHNAFPDNNINASGVTVDLSRLSAVTVNGLSTANLTASIGPGARWAPVYTQLAKQGVTVGGGRGPDIGVGGLTLGGGNSFFAARYGFACDTVVNFEVVLASGEIVNANADAHADLWQVLKGGSNNFGIVTRLDLTAFKTVDIWGGVVLYPASTIPAQIDAFVKFNDEVNNDPYASLISFSVYSSATNSSVIENTYEYTKPSAPAANSIFTDLLAISPQIPGANTLGIRNLTSLVTELVTASGTRDLFSTLSFNNDANVIREVHAISDRLLAPIRTTKGLNWVVMFQPLPTIISQHSQERGGNIMGLDRAKGSQVLLLLFAQWADAADDALIQGASSKFIDQVRKMTVARGKANDWIYLNYANYNQDPLGSYGKKNVEKMQRASRKYDPDGVFQKLVPGGFKIADAKPTSP